MAVGYTPASATPVPNRTRNTRPNPSNGTRARLRSEPTPAAAANKTRAVMRSGRFRKALMSVPTTNPSCTAMVSHERSEVENPFSRSSAGPMALVLNQMERARIVATDMTASTRPREPAWSLTTSSAKTIS